MLPKYFNIDKDAKSLGPNKFLLENSLPNLANHNINF